MATRRLASPISMTVTAMTDERRYAPAASRNREPILGVLLPRLAQGARLLEVASGSGEHALWIAQARPDLAVQPSDPDVEARASIAAWCAGIANIAPPLALDAAGDWPAVTADAVLCINMIHIAPWAATLGLMRGAAAVLGPGGALFLYGPYRVGGVMVESNQEFDARLRAENPSWGVRALEDVVAAAQGFAQPIVKAMPANNLLLEFRRL